MIYNKFKKSSVSYSFYQIILFKEIIGKIIKSKNKFLSLFRPSFINFFNKFTLIACLKGHIIKIGYNRFSSWLKGPIFLIGIQI